MNIILYTNKAENIRLDKTDFLTKLIDMDGVLREQCSMIDPSILISDINAEYVVDNGDNYVVGDERKRIIYNNTIAIINTNYVYIPAFGRYYFVVDKTWVRNNLMRLDLKVDVLMSFKEYISRLSVQLSRTSDDRFINDRLTDDLCVIEEGYDYSISKFGEGVYNPIFVAGEFSGRFQNKIQSLRDKTDNWRIVVTYVSGYNSNLKGSNITPLNRTLIMDMQAFSDFMQATLNSHGIGSSGFFVNFSDYIVNAYLIPFDFVDPVYYDTGDVNINIGSTPINFTTTGKIFIVYPTVDGFDTANFSMNLNFTFSAGVIEEVNSYSLLSHLLLCENYQDVKGSRTCLLYLPYYGYCELDLGRLSDYSSYPIFITYSLNIVNGVCDISIHTSNNWNKKDEDIVTYLNPENIIQRVTCNMGYQLPVGGNNYAQLQASVEAARIRADSNFTQSVIPKIVSGAVAIASIPITAGTSAAAIGVGAQMGFDVLMGANKAMKDVEAAKSQAVSFRVSGNSNSSIVNLYDEGIPFIVYLKPRYVQRTASFYNEYGLPSDVFIHIGDIRNGTINSARSVHVETLDYDASYPYPIESERNEIHSILTSFFRV